MDKQLTMPRFYYYRGRSGSDRNFIEKRMSVIPDHRKHEVALEYERLYLHKSSVSARKAANEYLHGIAREYRPSKKAAA